MTRFVDGFRVIKPATRQSFTFDTTYGPASRTLSFIAAATATQPIDIDWGDGTVQYDVVTAGAGGIQQHTYATNGVYKITVSQPITPGAVPVYLKFTNLAWLTRYEDDTTPPYFQHFDHTFETCRQLNHMGIMATDLAVSLISTWRNCALTSFPAIKTSNVTDFTETWMDNSALTSFPVIDTKAGVIFNDTWNACYFAHFPQLDFSSGTSFRATWMGCNKLLDFPLVPMGKAQTVELAWRLCAALRSFPALDLRHCTNFARAWENCSRMTAFDLVNVSSGSNFESAWLNCGSLTSFPSLDTHAATNLQSAWGNCTSLTAFPLLPTGRVTNFSAAWKNCLRLTAFPQLNTSSGNLFQDAWNTCKSLTAFPALNTSSGIMFDRAWMQCTGLTSFPLLPLNRAQNFENAWAICSQLADFPAHFFDHTDVLRSNALGGAFTGCPLTVASVENILVSLDVGTRHNVHLSLGGASEATWTAAAKAAKANLITKGWTIVNTP